MENTNTRWRIAVKSPAVLETTTEALPALAADEALVETRIVGVCGSDTHAFHGKHPQIKLPFYPGSYRQSAPKCRDSRWVTV